MLRIIPGAIVFLSLALLFSCEKENISYDSALKLEFSADTILFDTVFTTIGSATRNVRVYNRNNSDIVTSAVKLAGGSSSPFRINIDGEPSTIARNIKIRSNDSLYVFVEVTIDPTMQNAPLYIPDSIVFETNGNVQDVNLIAWGQDVHLLSSYTLEGSNTFSSEKPYLIHNYLYVAPNSELTVNPGAKLHFHNQAILWVDGTLKVSGSLEQPVVFEGDRLEDFYSDKAGQWSGIYMSPVSRNNIIDWAIIKNAINGVAIDTFAVPDVPALVINNTRIENMSSTALLASGSIVKAGNCLFANAGIMVVVLRFGGYYEFNHCTIVNYWSQYMHRKGPALIINNFYESSEGELINRDIEKAYFGNCIIYGSRPEELEIDNVYKGQEVSAKMEYLLENSILRIEDAADTNDLSHFINTRSANPNFIEPFNYNFQLDTLSPAKDFGLINIATEFPIDLYGNSRLSDNGPDLGCFERLE